MSAHHTAAVWANTDLRGTARLIMLAVADCANHAGVAEASVRTLAAMTQVDKDTVSGALGDLRGLGYVQLVSKAKGSTPARYRITLGERASVDPLPLPSADTSPAPEPDTTPIVEPAPEPKPVPVSQPEQGITQIDVNSVLKVAGIKPPADQPFYWSRREHKDELAAALKRTGLSVASLCEALRQARSKGKTYEHQPRRIAQVVALVGSGRVK